MPCLQYLVNTSSGNLLRFVKIFVPVGALVLELVCLDNFGDKLVFRLIKDKLLSLKVFTAL